MAELGLRGRKALITGASRGIGRACAEVLAEEGCDVVLVSRTAADLEAARAKITAQHNVAVRCFPLDLSDSKSVDTLAAECPETEILINNAGAIPRGTIAEIDEARWREAWDLKVFGYINMTRRFYALMAQRKNGHHQHHRHRRRECAVELHHGIGRKRVADGVHPGDGRHCAA
jgi:short-subunit dehydrogenase